MDKDNFFDDSWGDPGKHPIPNPKFTLTSISTARPLNPEELKQLLQDSKDGYECIMCGS